MRNKAGFTLIEIMVSLVLVGLIAAISGTAVITATRSYLFAKENDAITQKAQLALGRLNREFTELMDVKAVNNTQPYLVYEVPLRTGGVERRAVAKVGNTVRMYFDAEATTPFNDTKGATLVDGVQTLSLMYNPSSGVSLWSMGQDIRNLFAVSVQIVLARPDTGGTVSFFTTVSPRNNNNSGGAALPSAANPPPEYSGKQCFVTTAAYGDADHPVVEVLRQFRDRVLLPTDPGKALVRYYYEVGPSLAEAIEDKPIACLLVRLLVTPLAGFALLSLSCPLLIPMILLLSWGLARLILQILKRKSRRLASHLQGQRGAMLVTLIAAMVVFAALGAVMIGMFGASALSQAAGNNSQRAYYLAESGFRYAASRYIAVDLGSQTANETARETLLESEMHGKTFSLGGDGAFRLDVYPYYYKSTQLPTGNELPAKVFGGIPLSSSDYNWGSWVKIEKPDGSTTYNRISGASTLAPNTVRFYQIDPGGSPLSWGASYITGSLVTPVCIPDRDVNSRKLIGPDSDGRYDLAFKAGSGALAFPEKNGIFMVKFAGEANPRVLSYRQRDITNNRLKGISDPNGGSLPTGSMEDPGAGPSYAMGTLVELMKFMRVESTGTFGTGAGAVNRKVTFFAPVGYAKAQPEPKKQLSDTMENLNNWISGDDISKIGSFRAGTSYGTTMRVDTPQVVNQAPGLNCLKFREFQVGINSPVARLASGQILYAGVQQEWLRASNYLSYDLEMKTYYTLASPSAKHAMGLTFRLDEEGNALGFTFARGVPGYTGGCDNDGIPHGWLGTIPGYTDYTPVLLFWMKQYAKKESIPAVETFVHPATPTKFDDLPPVGTGTYAIRTFRADWQNGERVRFTNTGGALPVGVVAGRDYFVRKVVSGALTYLFLFDTEASALNTSVPYWTGLQDITALGSGTTTIIVQDPSFTKLAHQVLDDGNEKYRLFGSSYLLKSFVTFMVRVIEAPSVSFISGGGASGREILSGETVYQTSNNLAGGTITAIYLVARNPVYRESSTSLRNWTGNAAQGVIMLERIKDNTYSNPATSPFTAGSKIFVGDHPGGTWAGTVGVPGGYTDQPFRTRDNWMLFYVGDPTGNTPADANPFNNYRNPVLRNSILWPPENVEDTSVNNDNFTLLRFSDYVNTTYCTSFGTRNNFGTGGDVVRFTSPDGSMFYSPQSGAVFPTKRSEVGLHAYGNDGQFTEYDDFAIQFGPGYGITRQGFLLPLQQ